MSELKWHAVDICAGRRQTRQTRQKSFTTYVRPLSEYATPVWSPFTVADITNIESVQRSFTERLPGLRHLAYTKRLGVLCTESLELRRLPTIWLTFIECLGLPYVRVSPDTSSFLAFVRAGFRNRRFVLVFGPIRKYIRTLPTAKAYDGMRQIKVVSFQYKMSVTSQNAILVQASCTCLLNRSKRCAHH